MRKVIEKHRRAALGINEKACPDHLFSAAWEAWEAVLERAKNSQGGFRNSLVSVLAPTGTISFLMSCDTTGVEPAFALVATKKLVGGGSLKMINESVESSLGTLGYSPDQIEDIRVHMLGHGHLPHNGSETGVCVSRLRNLGFADEVIDRVNRTIPGCTDINCAFSMVPEAVAMIDLFASRAGRGDTSGLPILQKMGFSPEEVEEANLYACGRMTMEGGPHLRPEHLAVFDCASPCPPYGKRSISPMGHVNMVAAVQPFLSGGVSKTISLPSSATPADIREIYIDAWRKGLKGVTVYRDGSKAAQPLSSGTEASEQSETKPCSRKRMPVERKGGRTVGVKIDGHRLYVTANPFEDGSLGEIFIVADKPTSLLGGFLNCFAKLVSIALQHGVSLLKLVEAFTFEQFDPQGFTTHPTFTMCKSIPDWIFRWLALEFLGDDSYAQVKPEKDPDALPAPKKVHPQTPVVNGKTCPKCGSVKLVRTGTCLACAECGESVGGCS
jgi:ribonucleoside-diphosphate reductase alpha chain